MFLYLSVILFTGEGCLPLGPGVGGVPPRFLCVNLQTATVVDGTHPTGIHSYLFSYLLCNCDELQWIVTDTFFNLQGFFRIAPDPSLFHL